jgi:hypothetical protein
VRENDRIEAEKRRQEAQIHAAALRKRSRILVAVLTVTAIIAVVAVILGVQANQARKHADVLFRENVALRLVLQTHGMLAGTEGGGDMRALDELLAGHVLAPDIAASGLIDAVESQRTTAKIANAGAVAWSVAVSPDGHRLASPGADNTVLMWNADTGQAIGAPLTGHTKMVRGVVFSPVAHRLASASDDHTVRLWNADTGQLLAVLTGHTDVVNAVAFSPDGHRLATASDDHTVRLWNADTGQPFGNPLTGHTAGVLGVAFSPDGKRLASGSWDKTVRIWPAVATAAMLCDKLTANMSDRQWREWVSVDIDYIRVCPGLPVAPD